jgi:hypothetical protein
MDNEFIVSKSYLIFTADCCIIGMCSMVEKDSDKGLVRIEIQFPRIKEKSEYGVFLNIEGGYLRLNREDIICAYEYNDFSEKKDKETNQ